MAGLHLRPRDKLTTRLACLVFGVAGMHRFHVGKSMSGLAQLTLGGGGAVFVATACNSAGALLMGALAIIADLVWVIVDLIAITAGVFRHSEGRWLVESGTAVLSSPPATASSHASDDVRQLQHRILKLAKQGGGVVTPTTVAQRTGADTDVAKQHLESLVDNGHAELQSTKDGHPVYVFADVRTHEQRDQLELL